MKKILALAAVATLFTGCDSTGGPDGPAVLFNDVVVTELTAGLTTPVLEIQDIAGREYFHADITPGASLGGFEIQATDRNMYVVLLDGEEYVAHAGSFRAADLTADPSFDLRNAGGTVMARATLDVASL